MTEEQKTESQVDQLSAINQSLERLSTQIDYEKTSLEEAASSVRECTEIQNRGAILKHGHRRQLGVLIGEIEEKEGSKKRKKVAADLMIPFVEVKRAVNEALVSKEDYQRYVENTLKQNKEITDSGTARAGKEKNKPRLLSAAATVLRELPWLDSLVKSLSRDYSGNKEDLIACAELLEKLSVRFLEIAQKIREKHS